MGTSALVPAWTPFSDGKRVLYRGLAERVFRACTAGMAHIPSDAIDWVAIDAERLKRVYDDLVGEAGVTVRFNTHLSAVERRDDAVDALVLTDKAGLAACRGTTYVDCTGDADLCAWASADFHKGNEKGERLMPATHCFVLTNVNVEVLQARPNLHGSNPHSLIYDILQSNRYPLIPDSHICVSVVGPRTVGFNAGHIWEVDNTDPASVSRALVQGRKMAEQYRLALAEFYPEAFRDAFLVNTGSLLGIRETAPDRRRLHADLDDYVERRSFTDEICRNCYFIDIHWAKDEISSRPGEFQIWDKRCLHYRAGESHGVPYRCLVPETLRNVLAAGRSISCEQIVQGSVRVMPVCLAMGEAAGAAASVAARHHEGHVRCVDVAGLRDRLRRAGAYLPDTDEAPASSVSNVQAATSA